MAEVTRGRVVDGRYQGAGSGSARGGMADVWLAEDTHLQRRVALKVLHRRFAQDREFVERFRREAEAAAGLQHPNIVAVFDRGEFEGTYYIAMQYLEGPTLKQLIDAGLTPEQAVGADPPGARGRPRFAHRHGVVHRDLKPQNVIVDAEGKAIVTDFGIARAGVSEITQTGSVMGTPHYLSPEQAQGFDVTAVSDLYSIGVMLYEALTGRVPFEGESAVAVAMKQVSQTPQRPSSINPQVSPGARRGGDAGAGEGARASASRAPTPSSPRSTRRCKRTGRRRRRHGRLRGAAAGRRGARGADGGTTRGGARKRRRAGLDPRGAVGGPDRRSWSALALTRDTTTEVPNVTGNAAQRRRSRCSQQNGFSVGDVKRGRARSAGEHGARAGPGRRAARPTKPRKTARSSPSSARSRR